jgi:DNA-binding SARP family transcriptional activator/tetratricopeptide (TPR) repeat protein
MLDMAGTGEALAVTLLGPFAVSYQGQAAGPWPRPSARRLCQLVLVSPGRQVTRDLACEELFGDLDPHAAARALSKALSMTRAALAVLGEPAPVLLEADLARVWAVPSVVVDADGHEAALRAALAMAPGLDRDDQLTGALAVDGELLADEPYADWAMRARDRLDALRQQARLALARDRAGGAGRIQPDAVAAAWEACFEHDPAAEEAAVALIRTYLAHGRRELAARVYERCAAAFTELGLLAPAALAEAYAAAAPAGAPRVRDEMRTVSVLSAEVAVPAGADLERQREIAASSIAVVVAAVEALGGTAMSVTGSGVQAVFGAPSAHEDDPERAVRAAFRALVAADLPVLRIGVETGPAVLGPIGTAGYAATGEVVATATALQSRAREGSALVGPVTRAAAGHLFSWGGSELIATGDSKVTASYLSAPRPGATTRPPGLGGLGGSGPLAGRDEELAALGSAVRRAFAGDGAAVLIIGSPGLGKTRLIQECGKRVAAARGRRPVWLEGRCVSYASSTPYSLYQQLLASLAGVTPDLPEAVVQPAIERALFRLPGGPGQAPDLFPPLARMMGLSAGVALGRKSPEEVHRATSAAWRSLVTSLTSTGPVVIVLEDLHWADPTSLRLTAQLAGLTHGRRLLILATGRPEADLSALSGLTPRPRTITLGRLQHSAVRELASSLIGSGASAELLDAVLHSVDGNPLFLEERLSSLLETRALTRVDGTWRLSEKAGHEVPQALERLVRSRMDRLSQEGRDVVKHAAVLGFEFPLSLLAGVCATGRPLEPVVAELRARDFLHDIDGLPEPAFRFRHAVIQEAIYQGLLGAERRQMHRRAAWALEAASAHRLGEAATVLACHFAAAGEQDRALRYFELAGDHATAAFANDEAVSSFHAALAIAGETQHGVELRAKLANVLWRTGRRDEARQAFRAALAVAGDGDPVRHAHLLIRLGRLEMTDLRFGEADAAFDAAQALLPGEPWQQEGPAAEEWLELMIDARAGLHTIRDEPERVVAILEEARPVLESRGSPARKYAFYNLRGCARAMIDRFRVSQTSIADLHSAIAAARQGDDEKDTGYGLFFLGWLLMLRGDLAAAQDTLEQALKLAERIGESILIGNSVLGLALTALRNRDTEVVRELGLRALAVTASMASTQHTAGAEACLAWLAWQDGRPGDVLAGADKIARIPARTSGPVTRHHWVSLWPLLAVHLDAGRLPEAVASARALLDPAQQRLPDDLEQALDAAVLAWGSGDADLTRARLAASLSLARDLRFC